MADVNLHDYLQNEINRIYWDLNHVKQGYEYSPEVRKARQELFNLFKMKMALDKLGGTPSSQAQKQAQTPQQQGAEPLAQLPATALGQRKAGTFIGSDGTPIDVPLAGTVTPQEYTRLGEYVLGRAEAPPSISDIPVEPPSTVPESMAQVQRYIADVLKASPLNQQQAVYQKQLLGSLNNLLSNLGKQGREGSLAEAQSLLSNINANDPQSLLNASIMANQLGMRSVAQVLGNMAMNLQKRSPKEKKTVIWVDTPYTAWENGERVTKYYRKPVVVPVGEGGDMANILLNPINAIMRWIGTSPKTTSKEISKANITKLKKQAKAPRTMQIRQVNTPTQKKVTAKTLKAYKTLLKLPPKVRKQQLLKYRDRLMAEGVNVDWILQKLNRT